MGALRDLRVSRVSKVNRNFSRRIQQTGAPAAASADLTYGVHRANLTACARERELMTETYTITRLDGWTDEQWEEIVEAVEDTVAAVGEDFERNA